MYIATHRTSMKTKNLAQQPYAVLSAGNADDTIIIEGIAHLVTDVAERERVNQLWMEKYVDPHSGAQATITHLDTLIYRVEISHIMAWEHGVVDTRTDWYFD